MSAGDQDLPPIQSDEKVSAGLYRHYKGGLYEVIDLARHSETLEVMVVYRALYGEHGLWVRPARMFNETIMVDGQLRPRFLSESNPTGDKP